MGADPVPKDAIRMIFSKCAVMEANARRPYVADLFESEGGVSRVGFEKLEALIGEFTNRLGQLSMVKPELR